MDPDEYIRTYGVDALRRVIANAIPFDEAEVQRSWGERPDAELGAPAALATDEPLAPGTLATLRAVAAHHTAPGALARVTLEAHRRADRARKLAAWALARPDPTGAEAALLRLTVRHDEDTPAELLTGPRRLVLDLYRLARRHLPRRSAWGVVRWAVEGAEPWGVSEDAEWARRLILMAGGVLADLLPRGWRALMATVDRVDGRGDAALWWEHTLSEDAWLTGEGWCEALSVSEL